MHAQNSEQSSMFLFADSAEDAARIDAIDRLHDATALYTAQPVVDELLKLLDWPNGERSIVDTSCGDGQFVGQALSKLLGSRSVADTELPSLIQGWELHPAAAFQARSRVTAILVAHGRTAAAASALAELIIHNRDFITEGPTSQVFDRIVGNPPYIRMLNVPSLLRDEYASHIPSYAAGDLLHGFLDRAAKTLRDGGQMGFVTSDRWLFNQGAATLRESIGKRFSIVHLERLDSASTFYRPKQRRAGSPPRVHPVLVTLGQQGRALTRDPIYPGVDSTRYAGMPTLGEIATVRIAPWLGTSGIFCVTAEEAAQSNLPPDVLVPAVDTDDVVGNTIGTPRRFAVLTRPDVRPCEAVLKHIAKHMDRMAPRGKDNGWMPPESFHRLDLSQPSLMVPRIARTPKAVRIHPHILPINHNLSIVSAGSARLEQIERALGSDLAAQWASEHAARLEGGFMSLTTTLLRKMPIEL